MQMDEPGNLTFKELTAADIPAIENFCAKCAELGYENNSSLASMKFSTAVLDKVYGPFEGAAVWVSMVEMFTIVPEPLSFMTFDAACAPDQTAFKLRSI